MKALIFDRSKHDWETSKGFELADVPRPKIEKDDDVIIRVHYAGVCGTDKGIWYRTAFKEQVLESIKSYRIIGHEFFGEIVDLGQKAEKNFELEKGDLVSCESHLVCGRCYQCQREEKHICINEKILGISYDGGFAEFVKVPAHIIWKTDTGKIRPEVAAMQEPFGNAVHAASKVNLQNKTIAIFGLGPIGLFLLLVARAMGAKNIIGVEPNPIAIEMAKNLGIDYIIPLPRRGPLRPSASEAREGLGERSPYVHDEVVTDEIMKITKGVGVDISFEMAGFNSSVNNCFYSTRRGGEIILFGIKTGDFVLENYNRLIVHGFTAYAVIGRQVWNTWEKTRSLLENPGNKIQENLFNVILDRGQDTILPINEYTKERFEQMMNDHPKFLIQF